MGKKTTAILNYAASAIVNVKQQCLADAVASLQMNISNAHVVTIQGLTADNDASVKSTGCKQATSQIDVRSIFGSLTGILDRVIQAPLEMAGTKTSFIASLSQALNVNVVETCFASSLAAVQVSIQNVAGRVTIDNVSVKTLATSAIANCLQAVQVRVGAGSMPMKQFCESNEEWMQSVLDPSDVSANGTAAAAQQQQQQQQGNGSSSNTSQSQKMAYTAKDVSLARGTVFQCGQQSRLTQVKTVWAATGAVAAFAALGLAVARL